MKTTSFCCVTPVAVQGVENGERRKNSKLVEWKRKRGGWGQTKFHPCVVTLPHHLFCVFLSLLLLLQIAAAAAASVVKKAWRGRKWYAVECRRRGGRGMGWGY